MATAKRPQPSPGLPKTIGVLNLLFGGVLLLCGIGCLVALRSPGAHPESQHSGRSQGRGSGGAENQAGADRRTQKTGGRCLDRRGEGQDPAGAREDWEAKPAQLADKIDVAGLNQALRMLWFYAAAEVITGPLLNFLMLVSGIGLILLKNWARVLAVWVAVLKIARLIALGVFATVFVCPALIRSGDDLMRTDIGKAVINKAIEEQSKKQGSAAAGPNKPEDLVQMMKASSMVAALFFYGAGVVYPVIVLALLTLPGARSACARPVDDEMESFPNPNPEPFA